MEDKRSSMDNMILTLSMMIMGQRWDVVDL